MRVDNLKELVSSKSDAPGSKIEKVLSILRKNMGMDVAFLAEFSEGNRVFKFVDTEDADCAVRVDGSDPLRETYCKRIADDELGRIISDTSENTITKQLDVTERLSIGAYMGVPIILSSGKVYGTFCCYKSEPDPTLNERDLSFLNAFAEIASELIEQNIEREFRYHEARREINSILTNNNLNIVFQPIYNLFANSIIGFESLSRFTIEPYRTPDVWFAEASNIGLGEELEMLAIKNAVSSLNMLNEDAYISINVSPEYIVNGALSRALSDVDLRRIVVEVTEHTPISDYAAVRRALEPLREKGIRLAIDDAGAGYASFQHILELEADIIKLDISLTQGINCESKKYLLAKSLCAFAKAINCLIIAEGVETKEELMALTELGVDKAQGYFLGRPMPIDEAISYAVPYAKCS